MRLKRIFPGHYADIVGSSRIVIYRFINGRWKFFVREGGTDYAGGTGASKGCLSLKRAKQSATQTWIQLQLSNIRELVRDSLTENDRKEFHLLINAAWTGTNELACCVLSDWLCDHGKPDMIKRRIIDPGNKARLAWPAGWEALFRAVVV
jgi:hypothetical protein